MRSIWEPKDKAAQQPNAGEITTAGSVQEPCTLASQEKEPKIPRAATTWEAQPQAPKEEVAKVMGTRSQGEGKVMGHYDSAQASNIPVNEEVAGAQRPDPPKKAKTTMPVLDKQAPATKPWIEISAHQRMGLPEEEDTDMIHVSAPPLPSQVPAVFLCSKYFKCQKDCVQC